jgi:hypothetical protein
MMGIYERPLWAILDADCTIRNRFRSQRTSASINNSAGYIKCELLDELDKSALVSPGEMANV